MIRTAPFLIVGLVVVVGLIVIRSLALQVVGDEDGYSESEIRLAQTIVGFTPTPSPVLPNLVDADLQRLYIDAYGQPTTAISAATVTASAPYPVVIVIEANDEALGIIRQLVAINAQAELLEVLPNGIRARIDLSQLPALATIEGVRSIVLGEP